MPKQRLDISNLRGMVAADRDPLTLPPGVARWAENLDPVGDPGTIKGLAGPTEVHSGLSGPFTEPVVGPNDEAYAWNGGSLYQVNLPSGSQTALTGGDTVSLSAPVEGEGDAMGEAVRFPRNGDEPIWVGHVEGGDAHGQFTSGRAVESARLTPPNEVSARLVEALSSEGDGPFRKGYSYHFAASWLYDGYQESPVVPIDLSIQSDGIQNLTVEILWNYDEGPTNPRVTDLIIYAVEDPSGDKEFPEDLPLYYVGRIEIGDVGWEPVSSQSGVSVYDDPDWSGDYGGSGNTEDFSIESRVYADSTNTSVSETITEESQIDVSQMDGVTDTPFEFIVEGNLTARTRVSDDPDNPSTAQAVIRVFVEDSNQTTIDSDIISVSAGPDESNASAPTIRLDNFTGSNAERIRVKIEVDVNAENPEGTTWPEAYAQTTIQDVKVVQENTSVEVQSIREKWGGPNANQFISGQTYQDRTGVARAVAEEGVIQYKHATTAGPYRVVGGPEIDAQIAKETTDASYVVRSKAYRPDVFDWTTDIAQVGIDVQGIVSAGKRVLVFCRTDTYVLDLQSFAVVQTLENVTAFNGQAVAQTPQGVVFADANGVYLWQESGTYRVLSDPIHEVTLDTPSVPQYKGTVTESSFVSMSYDPDRQMVILSYDGGGWGLYFPLPSSREQRVPTYWTHLSTDVLPGNGHLFGWNGNLYTSTGSTLEKLFDSSPEMWTWITGAFGPDERTRESTFYRADIIGDLSNPVQYREDETSWANATSSSGGSPNHPTAYEINSNTTPPWTRVTRHELRFEGDAGDTLRAIGLVYRPQRAAADR